MSALEFIYYIVMGAAALMLLSYFTLNFIVYPKSNSSRNERDNVQLNTLNTNSLSSNRISSNRANNTLSSEFVDPLPLYIPPTDSTQGQAPNSVQIQMPMPPQELLDRPPTYKP
jgi:hypothetical protein